MKTVIKTTIGILAITFASISVSQAESNRHNRDFDRAPQKQHSQKFDRRDDRKHMKRQHRGNHLNHSQRRPHSKHTGWKRHYREHKRVRAIKQLRRDRAYRRTVRQVYRNRAHRRAVNQEYRSRAYNRNYGYSSYVAPSHRVTYSSHSHANKIVPVLAGGLIGSSIANNVSHGDPAATVGGAIFGAIIGDAIARH